jgi:DNA-binding CsgD family transcriptional regulator
MAAATDRARASVIGGASSPDAESSMRYVLDRLADGPNGPRTISVEILLSWRQSANSGLLPNKIRAPYDPDIDTDGRLRWAAAPAMSAVSADLADAEVALLLTDNRGHVIERWAAPTTATAMDRIGAAAGFVCAEAIVGTNSVGAALRTRNTSVVRGFEHFADGLTAVSCAATPVTDPLTGRQLGVVNMTCAAAAYSTVMPALVGRIGHETQQRLLGDYDATATALYAAFLQVRRRAKGPVAVLDARSMFVNAAGAAIVDPADRAVLWDWAEPRLGTPSAPAMSMVALGSGIQNVRCEAVYDGDRIAGAVIWLGPTGPPIPVPSRTADRATRWAILTDAQQSIAEHVAHGLTNRETASQLFISTHTVDYHLRQIFRKLGLRSRVELARVVAEASGQQNRT